MLRGQLGLHIWSSAQRSRHDRYLGVTNVDTVLQPQDSVRLPESQCSFGKAFQEKSWNTYVSIKNIERMEKKETSAKYTCVLAT